MEQVWFCMADPLGPRNVIQARDADETGIEHSIKSLEREGFYKVAECVAETWGEARDKFGL